MLLLMLLFRFVEHRIEIFVAQVVHFAQPLYLFSGASLLPLCLKRDVDDAAGSHAPRLSFSSVTSATR